MGNHTRHVGIRKAAFDAVVEQAREAAPAECCGMLLGSRGSIVEAAAARNLSPDANRFLVDPVDHIRVRREGRARGLDVIGFYHSHPHSPAVPSATDLAEAAYPDHLSLIVCPTEPPEVRLFELRDGATFLERALIVS